MRNPVSIFIMDVSSSSVEENFGKELTSYLKEIVNWIEIWTEGIVKTKVKHRMGDEIILASNNYATAYRCITRFRWGICRSTFYLYFILRV